MANNWTIACLGDSLTKGQFSYNWVSRLAAQFSDSLPVLNFGVNGSLSYNALQQLQPLINHQPSHILILLGTNDILATLNERNAALYARKAKLPQPPGIIWYRENMEAIIQRIRQHSPATIVLISVPLLGEDLTHPANLLAQEYNHQLYSLAVSYDLSYLPFFEATKAHIAQSIPVQLRRPHPGNFSLYFKALFRKYVLGQSFDTIASRHGFLLSPDAIHLNSKAGEILLGLLNDFFRKESMVNKETAGWMKRSSGITTADPEKSTVHY